mmetsp:Transcript_30038/g.80164  ORF Transcript_30038/g.80164 Transcript_30038/m.80164 type:complete len:288 (+) Transcript_30038:890-1753(+)
MRAGWPPAAERAGRLEGALQEPRPQHTGEPIEPPTASGKLQHPESSQRPACWTADRPEPCLVTPVASLQPARPGPWRAPRPNAAWYISPGTPSTRSAKPQRAGFFPHPVDQPSPTLRLQWQQSVRHHRELRLQLRAPVPCWDRPPAAQQPSARSVPALPVPDAQSRALLEESLSVPWRRLPRSVDFGAAHAPRAALFPQPFSKQPGRLLWPLGRKPGGRCAPPEELFPLTASRRGTARCSPRDLARMMLPKPLASRPAHGPLRVAQTPVPTLRRASCAPPVSWRSWN